MKIIDNNKIYKYKSSIVYSCQYHVIWTTKYRRKVLNEDIQKRLIEILREEEHDELFSILEIDVMEDHVHILIDVNPFIGVYKIISKLKGVSSYKLRNEFNELKKRLPTLWTRGKFVSTVGSVSLDVVKKYIESQKNV